MTSVDSCSQYHYYRQIVDNKEEVFQLKNFYIDLGERIGQTIAEEEYITSDEEFRYFGYHSGTEYYSSGDNGFHRIVEEYNQRLETMAAKSDDDKPKSKKLTKKKTTKRRSNRNKTPETPILEVRPEPEPMKCEEPDAEECVLKIGEQTLLEDDFYETNMQFFMSQSLPVTQSSALIQQNGRFAYYHSNDMRDESLKVEQNVDHLLIPLTDLVEETNCWPLVLKTITEYIFAFRKSSKFSKYLAHKLLAHYNWSEDKYDEEDGGEEELALIKGLHNQFLDTFMRQILLSCYSRDSIMEVIGGTDLETNAWPFISKLTTYLINESIRKSDAFSMAFTHLKHIVDVLVKDFEQFLSESEDYCVDIQRIERQKNYRPLICRLIWSQKSPNYLNSVLKQLIFLIAKAIKIGDDYLLRQLFRLFEVSAECFRIGSGNVRPYTSFTFDKPTPITELFLQLTHQSLATNQVFEKLLKMSNVCWIRVQFCGHFMTHFILDLKNKYLKEKHRKISLKLIVECLTNAKLLTKSVVKPTTNQSLADPKSRAVTPKSETSRRRSSVGLVNKDKRTPGKEWSKKNKYGENGLHTACIKGQTDRLRQILQLSIEGFGPDPNDMDNAGYTPLCEAAIHSHKDCIRALIEWQNHSNKTLNFESGPDKQTALHDCIQIDAIECAQLIIESGGPELLNIRREFDGKTPKDLIKSERMRQMVESMALNACPRTYSPKIKVNSPEDSHLFIQIVIDLVISYIETTKIDHFLDNSEANDDCIGQELWPNLFFELFQREISESDISSLIEDLAVLRKLPKIIENLKTLFEGQAVDLIGDLELALSLLFI